MTKAKEHKEIKHKDAFVLKDECIKWAEEIEHTVYGSHGEHCKVNAEKTQRYMEANEIEITKENFKAIYHEVR
jgi:hypothetical protein